MAWGEIEYLMTGLQQQKGSPNVVKYGETAITDGLPTRRVKARQFFESFSGSHTNKRPFKCCLYSHVAVLEKKGPIERK